MLEVRLYKEKNKIGVFFHFSWVGGDSSRLTEEIQLGSMYPSLLWSMIFILQEHSGIVEDANSAPEQSDSPVLQLKLLNIYYGKKRVRATESAKVMVVFLSFNSMIHFQRNSYCVFDLFNTLSCCPCLQTSLQSCQSAGKPTVLECWSPGSSIFHYKTEWRQRGQQKEPMRACGYLGNQHY